MNQTLQADQACLNCLALSHTYKIRQDSLKEIDRNTLIFENIVTLSHPISDLQRGTFDRAYRALFVVSGKATDTSPGRSWRRTSVGA